METFDIIGLTETWIERLSEHDILSNFISYVKPAEKIANAGRLSGGIYFFVKKHLHKFITKTWVKDCGLFIMFDKTLFGLDKHVLYCCVYSILLL